MIAEGCDQAVYKRSRHAAGPDGAPNVGRWRPLCRHSHWSGIGACEPTALRRWLTAATRRAGMALWTARREQPVRSTWWIARRRLRARLFALGNTRGQTRVATASSHTTVHDQNQTANGRHIVVIGDSLAAGKGDPVVGLELVGWVDRLAVALRHHPAGVRITNLARNGLTTVDIIQSQLDPAMALRPDLIVVVAGGNDLMSRAWDAAAFRGTYGALLARLVISGATVMTTTWHNVPLAVSMPPALARQFSGRLGEASTAVREVSRALGVPCLDFWLMPDLLDSECYSVDGIHPNARGYLRVANVIADGLGRHGDLPVPCAALRSPAEQALGHEFRSNGHAAP